MSSELRPFADAEHAHTAAQASLDALLEVQTDLEKRVAAASRRLYDARLDLARARRLTEEQWNGLDGTSRHPDPAYHEPANTRKDPVAYNQLQSLGFIRADVGCYMRFSLTPLGRAKLALERRQRGLEL